MQAPAESVITPASYVQRSMWAFALRHPRAPLNEMVIPWRIQGPLRADLLERALNGLVERHPTLRARLQMIQGVLCQVELAHEPVHVEHLVIEGEDADARLRAAIALLQSGDGKSIDVVAGPSLRVRLLALAPDDHVLCLNLHHAMCDGGSIQVIVRDLTTLYRAHLLGVPSDLAPLEEQYADVAMWEIDTYESGGFAEEIRYWRQELADAAPPVALPSRNPRKGNRDWTAASPMRMQPLELLNGLRDLARQQKVSVYAVMVAALAVLLHHRSGSDDMLIGVPTLNRWSAKSMLFVGCATSLLPARVRVARGAGFDALCSQVNATIRRMLAYGRIPLELIIRETQDSLLGGPVFPVWCQFLEASPPLAVEDTGLTITGLASERPTLLADLDVDMLGTPDGLRCEFAHRSTLFELGYVESMLTDYGLLLDHVRRQPKTGIAELCARLTGPAAPGG